MTAPSQWPYGELPPAAGMRLETAWAVVRLAQATLARIVAAIDALEDDAVTAAGFVLRDLEDDLAAYLLAASARSRELGGHA